MLFFFLYAHSGFVIYLGMFKIVYLWYNRLKERVVVLLKGGKDSHGE